jgi:hypothetical protein
VTRTVERLSVLTALPLLMASVLVAAGCLAAPSGFQKATSDAGSTFLAAAATLRLRHEDKLTRTYVVASFENYRDALRGVPDRLPTFDGAPGSPIIERLATLHRDAWPALSDPCLDDRCEWRAQLAALELAGSVYLSAAEGGTSGP